jgi:hypothetical protein
VTFDDDLREQIRKAGTDRSPVARAGRLVGKVLNLASIFALVILMPVLLGTLFVPALPDNLRVFGLFAQWAYGVPLVGGLMTFIFAAYYMISRTIRP